MGRVLLAAGPDGEIDRLAEALRAADLSVRRAESGVAAIDLLEDQRVECVVGTETLPDMDGVSLLRRVRERDPDLPVLLLVGPDEFDLLFRAHAADIRHVLTNEPDRYDEVADRVQDLIVDRRLATDRDRGERAAEAVCRLLRRALTAPRDDLVREICRTLTASGLYPVAWFCEYDAGSDRLVPHVAAGIDVEQLKARPRSPDLEPGGDVVIREIRAVEDPLVEIAVPIGHGEVLHGALLVNSRAAPDYGEREALGDLGGAVGAALESAGETAGRHPQVEAFASLLATGLADHARTLRSYVDRARDRGVHRVDELEGATAGVELFAELAHVVATGAVDADRLEPTPLEEVARRAWERIDPRGARLRVADSERIYLQPTLVSFVFETLFARAVERAEHAVEVPFHGTEVDLDIRFGCLDDGFYVEETGGGLAGEASDADVVGGTADDDGIGLAVVEWIIEAHGWDLSVTSSDDGATRVEVTYPAGADPP